MKEPRYETLQNLSPLGIHIAYVTTPGGYHPMHWHQELEILYPLNGSIELWIEKQRCLLNKKNLAVIESSQVHSTYSHDKTSMFLDIHLSKSCLTSYLPDIELYQIHCTPPDIRDDNFPQYREVCELIEELTRTYIMDDPFYPLKAEGLILHILACLLQNFSVNTASALPVVNKVTMERIRDVITYVDKHFRDPISLQDAAGCLGLGTEYFCRFFKKNMGMSFLNYLNEVRLSHVYRDLMYTDSSVAEIMEANGFTNQKLFNRSFKELYGQTPSSIRHMAEPK